ncbi:Rv1355c family protein [Virgisporangium ochraceum]|uniref:THIF-type NAD/FAD binding fold domain-containing protein n=1 Tax=Virgisporangium ochraceum TaxID=65505 RepID=A0A8J4A1G5_9ACTN|nr:Rv1355c family protein [Virgisporangium ochraceum]GIJ72135.1 hypothetical protein Voc01_070520 [Virgisporangium ochraceum]
MTAPWRPVLADADGLPALRRGHAVTGTHDTITDQLAELVTGRSPQLSARPDLVTSAVADHLAGVPAAEYGTWVLYPWIGRLVHVLPEAEFREVRHDRNRYKITAAEQEALAARRIGVIGLSVGAAVAVTLAQEGVGRQFRLADPDHVSLSNTNRLRASVADLGVAKVVLAARQMYEIDPYLDIRIWPAGLDADTADGFLTGLDLVLEECDDVVLKVLARERARAHRIPVIMETNERGMLDIERYDLEPDRPVLHGLLGGLAAADLAGLTPRERIPVVLAILGGSDHSPRFGPSLLEIGETIGSWPQLASGVALGAATATDAARRLLLGDLPVSGRFYVDLDRLVAAGAEAPLPPLPEPADAPAETPETPDLPLPERGAPLDEEGMRRLVALGVRAPSGGNAQPWHFTAAPGLLRCRIDARRPSTLLDRDRTATHLAIGAASRTSCSAPPRPATAPRPGRSPTRRTPDWSASCASRRRPTCRSPRWPRRSRSARRTAGAATDARSPTPTPPR